MYAPRLGTEGCGRRYGDCVRDHPTRVWRPQVGPISRGLIRDRAGTSGKAAREPVRHEDGEEPVAVMTQIAVMALIAAMAGGRHDPDRRHGLDRCDDPARHEDGEELVTVLTRIAVMA